MRPKEEPTAIIEFNKRTEKALLNTYKKIFASSFAGNHSASKPYVRQDNKSRRLIIYGEAKRSYLMNIILNGEIECHLSYKDDPKEVRQKEPVISPELEARLLTTIPPRPERTLEITAEEDIIEEKGEEPKKVRKERRKNRKRVDYGKITMETVQFVKRVYPYRPKLSLLRAVLETKGYDVGANTLIRILNETVNDGKSELGREGRFYCLK